MVYLNVQLWFNDVKTKISEDSDEKVFLCGKLAPNGTIDDAANMSDYNAY